MDTMARTSMAIEREIEDARSIRDTVASDKRILLVREKS